MANAVIMPKAGITVESCIIGEWQKTIASLEQEIARLRDENNKLEETVKWMHDLIWQMVREREDENVEFEL